MSQRTISKQELPPVEGFPSLGFQEKVFYREYMMGIYQIAQAAVLHCFSDKLYNSQQYSLFGGFVTFFLHKYLREGLRVNSMLLLLSEALIVLRQTKLVKVPILAIVSSIAAYIASIKKFKVYTFPKPRGSYPVGYIHRVEEKLLKNPQEDLKYSAYYPCVFDPSKSDQKWMITEKYWTRMHDTTMKDKERPGKVPKFFFRFQCSYLYKIQMGVLNDADLIPIEELYYKSTFEANVDDNGNPNPGAPAKPEMKMDKFPVVIISHGLAAHCNAYTLFAKELASNGYIVISLDHHEEIKNPYLDREENRVFRKKQLLDRLETTQKND